MSRLLLWTGLVAFGLADCGGSTTIDASARGPGPVADDGSKIVTLSSGAGGHAVAIDGDQAYFTTDSAVLVAPLAGGTARVVVGSAHPVAGSSALAVDGTSVFWPEQGSTDHAIRSTSKTGGTARDAAAALTGTPLAVVVDATDVYFSTDNGEIGKVSKQGGDVNVLAKDQGRPVALTVDEEGVYWASEGTAASPGTVRKVYKAQASGVITLAVASGTIEGIAVDDTCLFFTDSGDGSIKMVWKDGSHATAMATNQPAPRAVVKQAATDSLYWFTGGASKRTVVGGTQVNDGAIMALVSEQGAPVRIVHGLTGPEAIATSDHAIVWSSGGSVYALAR